MLAKYSLHHTPLHAAHCGMFLRYIEVGAGKYRKALTRRLDFNRNAPRFECHTQPIEPFLKLFTRNLVAVCFGQPLAHCFEYHIELLGAIPQDKLAQEHADECVIGFGELRLCGGGERVHQFWPTGAIAPQRGIDHPACLQVGQVFAYSGCAHTKHHLKVAHACLTVALEMA